MNAARARTRHGHDGAMGTKIRGLIEWWIAELALVAERDDTRARPPARLLLVALHEARASFFYHAGARTERLGELPRGEDGRLRGEALRRLAGGRLGKGTAFGLTVPPQGVLQEVLTLPDIGAGDVRDLLAHQIDRLTPYPPERVHFAWERIGRAQEPGQMRVRLTVVPRAVTDPMLDALAHCERAPDHVAVVEKEGAIRALVPLRDAGRPRRGRQPALGRGLAVCAVLALLCIAWPVAERYVLKRQLEAEAGHLAPQARAAATIRSAAERVLAEAAALAERSRAGAKVSTVLKTLSEHLPDDAWVEKVTIEGATVTLVTHARDVQALSDVLNAALALDEARATGEPAPSDWGPGQRVEVALRAKRVEP